MDFAVFAAQILAIAYLSFSIGSVVDADYYKKMASKMLDNPMFTYFMWFIMIILGMIVIQMHNVWVGDWTVLITIVWRAGLIKGISFIAFPKLMEEMSQSMLNGEAMKVLPVITLVIGLLFGYFGFFAG